MLTNKFKVHLYSPLGVKNGTLFINNDGSKLFGHFNILNTECSFQDGLLTGNIYEFVCTLNTVIGDIICSAHLSCISDRLYGMVETNKGCMAVTGEKILE